MKIYSCRAAQTGYFAGPVFYLQQPQTQLPQNNCNPKNEIAKYEQAKYILENQINSNNASGANEEILQTVLLILKDESLNDRIISNIKTFLCSAEFAVYKAAKEICDVFSKIEDDYISQRRDDILGVANKLIAIMSGDELLPNEKSVICANELSPAQLTAFDNNYIGAILTENGSPNSHVAIMAGNLGIPYLYGSGEMIAEAKNADFIIVDGDNNTVVLDPSEKEMNTAIARMDELISEKADIMKAAAEASCKTKIYANISSPEEVETALRAGADGIGLFRTEFLYLNSEQAPAEDEQFEIYKSVLMAMGEKEVIIRTMDLGSDKRAVWLNLPAEANPALGLRGIRVSLEHKDIFVSQIRALLRAGVYGKLKVMLPMISAAWELDEAIAIIDKEANGLKAEGIDYKLPKLGVMIETPAAALISPELAERVSFFSIGTNDLSQYTLAVDREAKGVDRFFDPYHEAVFKLIGMTVRAGHEQGIMTGVCGRLAADTNAIKRLIAEGVDELSVPVGRLAEVRLIASGAEENL